MNRAFQVLLTLSLILLSFFGFISLQTKVELQRKDESILLRTDDKKSSYGEGEYYKIRIQWEKTDNELFQKIMSASARRNEIILLREYKLVMEEILEHIKELDKIEPPFSRKAVHQEYISLNHYAYQACLHYFKDYQMSQRFFRKYVTTFYRLYAPETPLN